MSIDYLIDAEQGVLVNRVTGVMTDAEIVGYMSRLIEDTSWSSGMNGFVDARGIEGFEVTSGAMKRASQIAIDGEHRFSGSRWAVVADRDVVFGMTRMYEMLRDPDSYQVQVFREPESACEWLGIAVPNGLG